MSFIGMDVLWLPIVGGALILVMLASVKKNNPQRWERINAGQDKDVELAKKVAVTTVTTAAKVIGHILKK
jgi:hypothetical protein